VVQNSRKEVNVMLKKEAEYFGDIVILPFIDRYELVVLKTLAICEYGVRKHCYCPVFAALLLAFVLFINVSGHVMIHDLPLCVYVSICRCSFSHKLVNPIFYTFNQEA
jgi:hypothetical protein